MLKLNITFLKKSKFKITLWGEKFFQFKRNDNDHVFDNKKCSRGQTLNR